MEYVNEKEKYAYWLANVEGFGHRMQKKLYASCQSAQEIYEQDSEALSRIADLREADVEHIRLARLRWDLDAEWESLKKRGIHFLSIESADYPAQLRTLTDAPYGLFFRGSLPPDGEMRVAIVGARMCSEYGRCIAREIGKELALHGLAVVSGMARGIDAAGHRGALDGGGSTYAVFGCGVDVCYPDYHKQLYYDIAAHGGLLSEYLPGSAPLPARFPQRNRLISALCDVVVIVEARNKSGSLITADCALEQGKDVYALPGRVTDTLSQGCNRLIAQGAGIILSVEDFLAELEITAVRRHDYSKNEKIVLEKDESLVYSCLGLLPVGLEEILAKTGLDIRAVGRSLASLMQKDCIEECFKNYYKTK